MSAQHIDRVHPEIQDADSESLELLNLLLQHQPLSTSFSELE
jgi:hypothetical protein